MVVVTKEASSKLFSIVKKYVGKDLINQPPDIFYWYRNVMWEIEVIETYDVKDGYHRYNMENAVGVIHYISTHINNCDVILVTDFDFNRDAIPKWQLNPKGDYGVIESFRICSPINNMITETVGSNNTEDNKGSQHSLTNIDIIRRMMAFNFD